MQRAQGGGGSGGQKRGLDQVCVFAGCESGYVEHALPPLLAKWFNCGM